MPLNEEIQAALKKIVGVRVAHEAMMLNDAQQVLAQDRSMTQAHQEKLLELPSRPKPEGDDVIIVGDVRVGPDPAPAASPAASVPTVARTGLSLAQAAGIGLLTMLSGAGITGGVMSFLATRAGETTVKEQTTIQQKAEPLEMTVDFWVDEHGQLQGKATQE